MRRSMLALLLAVSAAVACSDPIAPGGTGAIRVELAMSGVDGQSSPFAIAIDGGVPIEGLSSGAVVTGLESGHHSLAVSGLAPNCGPVGPMPKAFAVNPPDTTRVSLALRCTAVTGWIEVRATTTGPDPDLDGYNVSVDGGSARALPPNGLARFTDLPGGTHTLSFSGLDANCTPSGPNPMEVDVPVGGTIRGTASTSFAVTCTAVTGALRISTTTTGPDPDPGYVVGLDATPDRPIVANGTYLVTRLMPGTHAILLKGIAPNCAISGPNPVTAEVANGDTTEVALLVVCLANPTLRVTVSTTGSNIPALYSIFVDGDGWYYGPAYSEPVQANGQASLVVAPGLHAVSLAYVPSNCVVTSTPVVSVTLPPGQTTDVAFTVECAPNPTLRVSVETTGPNAPASYLVGVDSDGWYGYYLWAATVPSSGSVSFDLLPGNHWVTLDQVPLNCVVTSPNNVIINVPLGMTTDLAFAVTCH